MNKTMKSILAVLVLCAFSVVAHSVWDSTTGSMPDGYQLCWGKSTVCIHGSSGAGSVQIGVGGVDQLSITSTAATFTGTQTMTGATTLASLAVTGASTLTGVLAANGGATAVGSVSVSSVAVSGVAGRFLGVYTSAQTHSLTGLPGDYLINSDLASICVSSAPLLTPAGLVDDFVTNFSTQTTGTRIKCQ